MPLSELLVVSSGALVGFLHSVAPGHWLPIVIMSKSRKWTSGQTFIAGIVASSGHILMSVILAWVGIVAAGKAWEDFEHVLETRGALFTALFGVIFAAFSYSKHHSCHGGHEHHENMHSHAESSIPEGPIKVPRQKNSAWLFLFSIGLSPCVASLPVFAQAAPFGGGILVATMIAFAVGVIFALAGAAWLVTRGLVNMDHPWIEHHGDTLTGILVAVVGLYLFLAPHQH